MIILPDRTVPRTMVLPHVREHEWRAPSSAVRKDDLGNSVVTVRFRLDARLSDGCLKWRGWFESRDDLDAFLWSMVRGELCRDRALWRMSTPSWHPDIGEELQYEFATDVFLTSTGSNTWTVPSDYNVAINTIRCLGAGGGGAGVAVGGGGGAGACGGGGGAYAAASNVYMAPGGSVSYYIGLAGSGSTNNQTQGTNGTTGGETYINGTAGSGNNSCQAGGGAGGSFVASPGTATGSSGGAVVNGSGYSGGASGNATPLVIQPASTGGGGAGGASGAGVSSSAQSGTGQTAGGAGNNNTGGGGSGGASGTNGGAGTNFDASHGSGGGGGGKSALASTTAGAGGNYGAGGGGAASAANSSVATAGAGTQGLIYISYTPATPAVSKAFNMPMLGM